MHRLRAIGAVLFAAAGFNAEQRSQLHVIPIGVRVAVHLLGAPEQVHQGQLKQRFDFSEIPVVANTSGHLDLLLNATKAALAPLEIHQGLR